MTDPAPPPSPAASAAPVPAGDPPAPEHAGTVASRILKAIQSGLPQNSNVLSPEDDSIERTFSTLGALEPPYHPPHLVRLGEMSNALRSNFDAMVNNVDGYGHTFEPAVNFDAADADARVAQIIMEEREAAAADAGTDAPVKPPTPEEVSVKKDELVTAMRQERIRLERHFEGCCEEYTFTGLRRRTRLDLECQGNAYVEVLRNALGEIAEYTYVPAYTVRLLPLDRPVSVKTRKKVGLVQYEERVRHRRFRRFVQVLDGYQVFFKEFGDRRVISRKTGREWPSVLDLYNADPQDGPATEMLHLRLHTSRTAYGIPRWIGVLLEVLGSRQAAEVNSAYFDNKSVPPLALLVSGGRLVEGSAERIETFIRDNIRGAGNYHKILVIEAETAGGGSGVLDGSGTGSGVKLDFKNLTEAQNKDALFQGYDQNNMDKVGMAFRVPRLLRGDTRDFNRATAEAALEFAEQQVFGPERQEFDDVINRLVFSDLGIKFWRYKSRGPRVRNATELGNLIRDLTTACVLTPGEARELAEEVFGREFKNLDAEWTKQPVVLTQAGLIAGAERGVPWTGDEGNVGESQLLPGQGDAAGASRPGALQVTPSAAAAVVTVNEVRASQGLTPLRTPDGQPDPEGDLTVTEFTERRRGNVAAALGPAGAAGPEVAAAAAAPVAMALRPPTRRRQLSREMTDLLVAYKDQLDREASATSAARLGAAKRGDASAGRPADEVPPDEDEETL